jgi:peroxiredoxin
MHNPLQLPDDLPTPVDDGGARHLPGTRLPDIALPATDGGEVNLAALRGRTVVYAYPRTGVPVQPLPEGWDAMPGARGCTPQSCAFRDHFSELKALGVAQLYGLSTQDTAYQKEAAERLHLPFALLSDAAGELSEALRLPTMIVEGTTMIRRLTLVVRDGAIEHVFYPVFPPDGHAAEVLAWLGEHPR